MPEGRVPPADPPAGSAPLTFHLVFIPGSVRYQLFFVQSLLGWSDLRFRLVANGCRPAEIRRMQDFCRKDSRLDLMTIPTNRPMIHDHVLNLLQARCREEAFCFMDSDIIATGPFMKEVAPRLGGYAGIFAGRPFYCRPGDEIWRSGVGGVCGEYDRTPAGLSMGGTFFAVYDNRILTDVRRASGFGFEKRFWPKISRTARAWCAAQGFGGEDCWFDTGKMLNLELLRRGFSLVMLDSPDLLHLGGISFAVKNKWNDARRRAELPAGFFRRAFRAVDRRFLQPRPRKDNPLIRMPFAERRMRYSEYFAGFLTALVDGTILPALPKEDDPDVRRRAQSAAEEIRMLYQRGLEPAARRF